jgi:uncharacterized membrane protein
MNPYALELFVHLCGVVALFGGIATWLFGYIALWRARRVETVREIAALMVWSGYVAFGAILVLGIAGIIMALTTWGGVRAIWIDVATVGALLVGLIGAFVIAPPVQTLATLARAEADGPLPAALRARTRDPVMGTGLFVYITGLFGIVYLMTAKPALVPSIVALAIAFVIGALAGVPLWRNRPRPANTGAGRPISAGR